jgi:cardiolipin synthase
MLDPLADKLLLTAAFIALALTGVLPAWLAVLVVARDLTIVGGALAYHRLIGRFSAAPSVLSKGNTVIQIVFVLTELLRMSGWIVLSTFTQTIMIAIVTAFTLASGLHYVVAWSCRARRAVVARKEGR